MPQETKKAEGQQVKVTLVKSTIRRQANQAEIVKGLGLRKLHSSRVLEDTPSIRGMIDKVKHLLVVEQVNTK